MNKLKSYEIVANRYHAAKGRTVVLSLFNYVVTLLTLFGTISFMKFIHHIHSRYHGRIAGWDTGNHFSGDDSVQMNLNRYIDT